MLRRTSRCAATSNHSETPTQELADYPCMLPRALQAVTRRTSRPLLFVATARAMSAKADLRYVSKPASDAAGQASNPAKYPRQLYPEIECHDSGMLSVGDGHSLYYDVSGNPNGVPCIFLHGGPGGGISPRSRRFFDPAFFRIVIFDQRGSGKSQPNAAEDLQGSLIENNTPKLVEDIEKLREHLQIDKWGMVLGGSWGSTLALAYAEAHPAKVRTLLLRGVFLFEPVRLRRPSSSTRERRRRVDGAAVA